MYIIYSALKLKFDYSSIQSSHNFVISSLSPPWLYDLQPTELALASKIQSPSAQSQNYIHIITSLSTAQNGREQSNRAISELLFQWSWGCFDWPRSILWIWFIKEKGAVSLEIFQVPRAGFPVSRMVSRRWPCFAASSYVYNGNPQFALAPWTIPDCEEIVSYGWTLCWAIRISER